MIRESFRGALFNMGVSRRKAAGVSIPLSSVVEGAVGLLPKLGPAAKGRTVGLNLAVAPQGRSGISRPTHQAWVGRGLRKGCGSPGRSPSQGVEQRAMTFIERD